MGEHHRMPTSKNNWKDFLGPSAIIIAAVIAGYFAVKAAVAPIMVQAQLTETAKSAELAVATITPSSTEIARPTFTPSPTQTQTPFPTLDVSNWQLNYTPPLISNFYHWTTGSNSTQFLTWKGTINNSIYDITLEAKHDNVGGTFISSIDKIQDFYFGADIQLINYTQGDSASLVFRQTDSDHYYTFELMSPDFYQVEKFNSGDYQPLIQPTESNLIQYGAYNNLAVLAIGQNFQFYINGKCVNKALDTDFTLGIVGFRGELARAGDVINFDVKNADLRKPTDFGNVSCPNVQ
jgi:hypothetical protein